MLFTEQALAAVQTTDQEVISPRAVSFVLPERTLLRRDRLCACHWRPRCSALPVFELREKEPSAAHPRFCVWPLPLGVCLCDPSTPVGYRRSSGKGRGPWSLRGTPELGEARGQSVGLQPSNSFLCVFSVLGSLVVFH